VLTWAWATSGLHGPQAAVSGQRGVNRPGAAWARTAGRAARGSPASSGSAIQGWTAPTRHRFATTLLARGLDVASVAKLTGHKTADMVIKRYAHVTDDYEERARQALGVSSAAPARRSGRG
jgi:integrase